MDPIDPISDPLVNTGAAIAYRLFDVGYSIDIERARHQRSGTGTSGAR